MSQVWNTIGRHIADVTGEALSICGVEHVGGGCINTAYVIQGNGARYFVKQNAPGLHAMFAAEYAGLMELAGTAALRVPRPLCHGSTANISYIVMEYIPTGPANKHSYISLGQGLAAMHHVTREKFGWILDNTIGSTSQINTPAEDWVTFWQHRRLGYQLDLATRNGYGSLGAKGELLMERIPALFNSYIPVPSLLHGDLWSGNHAFDVRGEPFVFDPAVYYGDRETDLAMTELFGGYPAQFYASYRESYPLDTGYTTRKTLYNLYHVLNHLNLFGGGYLGQAAHMIDRLMSDI